MRYSEILIHWYLDNKRNLPWRETQNPYNIWLSEVILQQTQINQGLPYYEAFITKYPTVLDLAKAEEQDVLNLWQGLGYYSRARNLYKTAKYVANKLNGKFPDNYYDLLKLKGVGDYTASAIASICFNEPTPVVDGNVYRFLSRYFGIKTPVNTSSAKKEFKDLAKDLIDKKDPATFNQAIMEFGSRQCKPQNPDCSNCVFNESCVALEKGLVKALPKKIRKQKINKRYFNFLVFISDNDNTILEQRKDKGIWQKLYQFPLIETSKRASQKVLQNSPEFKKLLNGQDCSVSKFNDKDVIHKLSHQHLYTRFWIIRINKLPKQGIPVKDLANYPVPILLHNFINDFNF